MHAHTQFCIVSGGSGLPWISVVTLLVGGVSWSLLDLVGLNSSSGGDWQVSSSLLLDWAPLSWQAGISTGLWGHCHWLLLRWRCWFWRLCCSDVRPPASQGRKLEWREHQRGNQGRFLSPNSSVQIPVPRSSRLYTGWLEWKSFPSPLNWWNSLIPVWLPFPFHIAPKTQLDSVNS